MKKLFAALLALMLMIPACAMACEETTVLIAKRETTYTYPDASYWALNEDCTLIGIKDADEIVPHLGVQSTHSQYVAGKLDNGWMREAGAVRTVTIDGRVIGLTKLCNVVITIRAEYIDLAQAVIHSLLGGDVEISAENTTVRRIDARSTSGDVEIGLPAGLPGVHAECATVSGEVLSRVSDAGSGAPVQIRAKSVSGDVKVG